MKNNYITKVYVRRRSRTGLGKNKRARNGCVLLDNALIGEQVIVMKYSEYLFMKRRIKQSEQNNKIIIKTLANSR